MKILAALLALGGLFSAVYFSYVPANPNYAMTAIWLAFGLFMFAFAAPETAKTISFFGNSIQLQEVKSQIDELKQLANHNISFLLELAQTQMRFGGVPEDKKIEVLNDTYKLLKKLEFSQKEISSICSRWHYWVEGDYVRHILDGNDMNHHSIPKDRLEEWGKERPVLFQNIPSLKPKDLRALFVKYDALTQEVEENIQDYEYYIEHKEHRNIDKWIKEFKHG